MKVLEDKRQFFLMQLLIQLKETIFPLSIHEEKTLARNPPQFLW